nr:transcription termination factor MTERF5, chloroplastic-like [Ipomoea batatas]
MSGVRYFSRRSPLHFYPCKPTHPSLFSIFFSGHAHTKALENPVLYNYLITNFNYPKSKALTISTRMPWIKTLEKPESVVHFFKSIGFSDAHIQSLMRDVPQLLSADIEKTLKPKIKLFQDLGISGPDMGNFMCKKAHLLTRSLDNVIRPCIDVLKDILRNDIDNRHLFLVMQRCLWIVMRSPEVRLLPNVEYLRSCGIVGTQLATLLRRQPRLFIIPLPKLKDLVSKVLDLGFLTDSRMLAHGLHSFSSVSGGTFRKKLGIFRSYGFSEKECLGMIRRSPTLLRTSEEKLKLGIEFFLNIIEAEKSVLLCRPSLLMFSMEERVLPRYQVLNLINSKMLLKKELSFVQALFLSEADFVEKYIARFPEVAEELLMAYKGHLLVSNGYDVHPPVLI